MEQVDLNSLMRQNPITTGMGLGMLDRNKQAAEANLARTLFQTDAEKQKLPGQLEQTRIGNETSLAQLPGIRADSSLKEDKSNLSRATYDQQLDEMVKGYKFKDRERELKEIKDLGENYGKAGAILGQLPGPARRAYLKEKFSTIDHPAFDQMNPDQLVDALNKMGEMSAKASRQFMLQAQKDEEAMAREREKSARSERAAQIRASVAQATKRAVDSKDPKKMEELETLLRAKALEAMTSDPETAQELNRQAEYIRQNRVATAAASRPPQAPQIDKAALGVPTVPQAVPQPAPLPVPGQAAPIQNNPAAADPNMAKLPQGTKALGNGIYQLPDGTKIKANK